MLLGPLAAQLGESCGTEDIIDREVNLFPEIGERRRRRAALTGAFFLTALNEAEYLTNCNHVRAPRQQVSAFGSPPGLDETALLVRETSVESFACGRCPRF
jgi:hypothetical protein